MTNKRPEDILLSYSDEYQWIAMDADGEVMVYKDKPEYAGNEWMYCEATHKETGCYPSVEWSSDPSKAIMSREEAEKIVAERTANDKLIIENDKEKQMENVSVNTEVETKVVFSTVGKVIVLKDVKGTDSKLASLVGQKFTIDEINGLHMTLAYGCDCYVTVFRDMRDGNVFVEYDRELQAQDVDVRRREIEAAKKAAMKDFDNMLEECDDKITMLRNYDTDEAYYEAMSLEGLKKSLEKLGK